MTTRRKPTASRCVSNSPGHRLHYIQARRAQELDERPIPASVTVHLDGMVDLRADGLNLRMWTHDPEELDLPRGVMKRAHWISRYSVLSVNGRMFSLASPDSHTDCQYPEPSVADETS